MKAQTKRNIGNIFGGLISNQKAIDGAKESPWWVAIIFLILSVFLPVIPSMVSTSKTDGGAFMSGYTYSQDAALVDNSLQFLKEGYELKFQEKTKLLTLYQNGAPVALQDEIYKVHTKTFSKNPVTGTEYKEPVKLAVGIMIYVDGNESQANEVNNKFLDKYFDITENFDIGKAISSKDKIDGTNYYVPSVLCLYKTGLIYTIKSIGKSDTVHASAAAEQSSWDHTNLPDGFFHRILTQEGKEKFLSASFLDSYTSFEECKELSNEIEYINKSYIRLQNIFTESYLTAKDRQLLISTFIYLGVYLVMVAIMGLLLFLLTRGKTNVYRYLTFWTCFKISCWASLSPALLGMILSFLIPSLAVMAFIILEGIRIMWLAMRQLKPQ